MTSLEAFVVPMRNEREFGAIHNESSIDYYRFAINEAIVNREYGNDSNTHAR